MIWKLAYYDGEYNQVLLIRSREKPTVRAVKFGSVVKVGHVEMAIPGPAEPIVAVEPGSHYLQPSDWDSALGRKVS